ncbi:MAG: response regulator transcription factor [Hahellaceae bacterium]|nr:response regulator transcription factor [Hahellaceae bacterium]MCP5168390.1 response regulator transcription factor [Hahellaceae bacterium]
MDSSQTEQVAVVDDDGAMREAMMAILESVGIQVQGFESGQHFLAEAQRLRYGCLVLDIRMPGLSGLEVQKKLQELQIDVPLILVTGHGDIEMAVEAMKRGARDFLTKPFRDQVLIDAVQNALTAAHEAAAASHHEDDLRMANGELQARLSSLTPREREVLTYVVKGMRSKQIAAELNIALKTVEEYRSRLLDKMKVRSSTELASLTAAMGGIHPTP